MDPARTFHTLAAAAAITIAAPAVAQDAKGYWSGALDVGSVTLTIGVKIARGPDGGLAGTFDSPDQKAFGIPLSDVQSSGSKLTFAVPAIGGSYTGEWDASQARWMGNWQQGGQNYPLALAAAEEPKRTEPEKTATLPAGWSLPSDEAIGATIDERIAERPGSGMVVGVVGSQADRVIAHGPDAQNAFDADTLFEIGSMTKVFTGLLLADMVLDGTVALDDPVAKFLPDGATMPSYDGRQITLANLSRQDSGLPRLPDNLAPADIRDPYADYTEANLLEFLANYQLTRAVGSQYEYSNLGVGLLGYVLARAASTDFESLLQERILDPLGMADTAIALSEDQRERFAEGRDEYNRPTLPWDLSVLAGAGALRSTTRDMLKFLHAAMDPQSPLAPAMQLALAEPRTAPGFRAGLGWMIVPAPEGTVVMHGGGTGGFRSHMAFQQDTGRAVVVLTNSAVEPSAQDLALHVLIGAPVAEAGSVATTPVEISREEVTLTDQQLDRVTGTYRFAPGMDMTILRDGDGLTATLTGQGPLAIYPRGPLEFFWRAVNAEIVFAEEDGQITGATFTQDGNSAPLRKVD